MDTVTRNKTIKLIGMNEADIRTSISDLIDNEDVKIEISLLMLKLILFFQPMRIPKRLPKI